VTVVLDSRADLTLANYRRVSVGGERVEIGPTALRAMEAARQSFMALLESDRTAFVYGVTSKAGLEAHVRLSPEEQREYSRRQRAGTWAFGDEHLDERVVRGIVFARLANFVEGNAKTRPLIAQRIARMLDGPLPEVPLRGQVGAGEILTLIDLMAELRDADDLEEGEQMALVNGSPCSAALAADVALQARNRLEAVACVLALSVEAFAAPLEAYDAALEQLWDDEHESEALRALRRRLAGAATESRRAYQAPVSFRILPRVLGQAYRAVEAVERAAATSLRSVSDNPVYVLPDADHPLGRVFSTGGFHNGMAYPALTTLTLAWADLLLLAERITTALHLPHVSGMPQFLARPDGGGATTHLAGWAQGSLLEEARAAATATLLPVAANDPQNDVALPTFVAYDKERRVAGCVDASLALLCAACSQALWVTGREPAPPLRPLLATVREVLPPLDDPAGRRPGSEVEPLAGAFARAALEPETWPELGNPPAA
jgi:histidine ammonia-lyase